MNLNELILDTELLSRVIVAFGEKSQTDMAIEEMSELTKAILKYRRAKSFEESNVMKEQIIEEIADVYIMLAQLVLIYDGVLCSTRVQSIAFEKMARLEERLKQYQAV
ncbi:MAG: hypothetical protein FWE08_06085 [Oscillospiraceae bacterium]|nr:hypothetical protein [Oscillospiraceae bacterium]